MKRDKNQRKKKMRQREIECERLMEIVKNERGENESMKKITTSTILTFFYFLEFIDFHFLVPFENWITYLFT